MAMQAHTIRGDRRATAFGLLMAGLLTLSLAACKPQALVSSWPDPSDPATTLADVERAVTRKILVPEMATTDLQSSLQKKKAELLVFDVREPAEYAQSHIEGAHRIDPSMSAAEFAARFGNMAQGKTVVFYCAVGVRSGQMLQRVQSDLKERGAVEGYNLRGGIFRWHAERAPVVTEAGPASSVHPFDGSWGKLLDRTIAARPDHRP